MLGKHFEHEQEALEVLEQIDHLIYKRNESVFHLIVLLQVF